VQDLGGGDRDLHPDSGPDFRNFRHCEIGQKVCLHDYGKKVTGGFA